jgi:hypothetical protein
MKTPTTTPSISPTAPLIFFALGVLLTVLAVRLGESSTVYAPTVDECCEDPSECDPEDDAECCSDDDSNARLDLDLDALFEALAFVESRGYSGAFNAKEDAAGLLQIRPIMVRDVNRIVGYDRWTLDDRWSAARSREMLATYLGYYGATSYEQAARRWNGGPDGDQEQATERYWRQVRERLVL